MYKSYSKRFVSLIFIIDLDLSFMPVHVLCYTRWLPRTQYIHTQGGWGHTNPNGIDTRMLLSAVTCMTLCGRQDKQESAHLRHANLVCVQVESFLL